MRFYNVIARLNHGFAQMDGLHRFLISVYLINVFHLCNLLIFLIRDSDNWQLNNKLTSFPFFYFHFYLPAMCFYNIIARLNHGFAQMDGLHRFLISFYLINVFHLCNLLIFLIRDSDNWQLNNKLTSFPFFCFHFQLTTMCFYNIIR